MMTIAYSLRRKDVWDAYWFTWRTGRTLKVSQLFVAGCIVFVVTSLRAASRPPSRYDVVIALLWAITIILILPIYPLVRFKHQVRTLTISSRGVNTQIGSLSREIPWRIVGRIRRNGNSLYIIGKTGNSFAVPDHAFSSLADRDAFETAAREWWEMSAA